MLISIGGLDYSGDLRDFKDLPNLPKEKLVYEAHSYSWQKVSKVVNVALPGPILGDEPGETQPGALEDVRKTCTALGDSCAGVTCTGIGHCYARRGLAEQPLRGATAAPGHFSQIDRFRTALLVVPTGKSLVEIASLCQFCGCPKVGLFKNGGFPINRGCYWVVI